MSGFLDKLAVRLTKRRENAITGFGALVRAVADDDKSLSAERAEACLQESGRSMDDLRAAVQLLTDRRVAAATLKRGQADQRELETVHAKIAAAHEAHNAAVEKLDRDHAAAVAELQRRFRELERHVEAARQAEGFLRESADRSATAEQTARLKQQLVEARRRRDEYLGLAQKAGVAAREAGTAANLPRGNWNNAALDNEGYRQGLRQKADAADKEEAEWLKQARPHADEVRRIEGELQQLEEAALTP